MKRKAIILLVVVLVLSITSIVLVGCKPDLQTHTVKFDLNYANAPKTIADKTVESGKTVAEPTPPTRDNYIFKGWFKDAETKDKFDFATEKITKDTTVYAKWSQGLYYIAGNFTGYDAKLEGFELDEVSDKEGWYQITIDLTEAVRDETYDGHYYKITNGTWDANGTWGVDNYALQPAPVSPTGGGLGSIWIYENGPLTVYFDSVNKVIYDNSMVRPFSTPRIYGDFNADMDRGDNWSLKNGEALELTDTDGNGIYTGLYKIPAYSGTQENGYSMVVAISEKYFIDQWGNRWGVNEQYKFDGEPSAMGGVSYLKPTEETIYEFSYNSTTHKTTVVKVEANQIDELSNPTIYGDFTSWLFEGPNAVNLLPTGEENLYRGFAKLDAYTGTGEGYTASVAVSKKLYDDQWGIRWGIEEQYKFDGTPAQMTAVSYLKPTEETIYEFIYNSETKKTTVNVVEKDQVVNLVSPTIYGDFTGWAYEGANAVVLTEVEAGIYQGVVTVDAYAGTGDGYMASVAVSKKLYDDEWGIRWGIEEQYKFDGTPAQMGGVSYLKPTKTTTYKFSYDSNTHITTVTEQD